MGLQGLHRKSQNGNKITRRLLLAIVVVMATGGMFIIYNAGDFPSSAISTGNNLEFKKNNNGRNIACNFLFLDPFNPTAMKFYQQFATSDCSDGLPTITFYDGSYVVVDDKLKRLKFGNASIRCWYRNVTYHISYAYIYGQWIGPFSDKMFVENQPPFVEVKCLNDREYIVSKMHHYITRSKVDIETPAQNSNMEDRMNVMLIGVDSLSSQLFKRAMPKTRHFLLNTMNSVEFNVYNKVGDNTFPNLLAIVCGKYEYEIPNLDENTKNFDHLPFVWKEYQAAGYRTQYVSDRPDFNNFSIPPTDSYNYPIAAALMKNKIAFNNNCFQDQIEINFWLNLIKEFTSDSLQRNKPFFSLSMFKRPTHDFPNQASAVDEHYYNFLSDVYNISILNNTMLFFFGDHGPRTGRYRQTFEGSIEERSSNMVVYVPERFKVKHGLLFQNLVGNAERLTTNFDVYETLRKVVKGGNIHFKSDKGSSSRSSKQRGISLFSPIPPSRTCTDADISPHFCMCNGGVPIVSTHYVSTNIASKLVHHMNSLITSQTDKCAPIQLQEVTSVILLTGVYESTGVYRIMFTTSPGGAAFEATVEYTVTLFFFTSVKPLGLISRTSMYRGLSNCVDYDATLKLYCYCKDLL